MTRLLPAAIIGGVVGAILGVALALLLTSPTQSRQASAPRPATVMPVRLPTRPPVADRGVVPTFGRPEERTPSPTIWTRPAWTEAQPSAKPTAAPTHRPRATTRPADGLRGVATWYRYIGGQAAAGPRLRAALGDGWRGETVLVNGVPVLLTDYMGTKDRDKVVDLDDGLFLAICGPLSLGVCDVEVRW